MVSGGGKKRKLTIQRIVASMVLMKQKKIHTSSIVGL